MKDTDILSAEIKENYPKYFEHNIKRPIKMKYGLNELRDNKSSVAYSQFEPALSQPSITLEETASFLLRWAMEIYPSWSTWMSHTLPGCKVSYKASTLRIVNKIKEMQQLNEIENLRDGWKRLTDLLRGSHTCTTIK